MTFRALPDFAHKAHSRDRLVAKFAEWPMTRYRHCLAAAAAAAVSVTPGLDFIQVQDVLNELSPLCTGLCYPVDWESGAACS